MNTINYWIFLIPLLTAFAGWLVIRIALYLIFHPRQPRKVLGLTVQGILPRSQKQIAGQAGEYAASSFSLDTLEQKIQNPKNFENVKPVIETHIDDFLRNGLKEQMPMISMFIGDKTIQSLKTVFIAEIEKLFPQVMQQFTGNLKKEFNIAEMVSSKVEVISLTDIEKQVSKRLKPALLMGFLVGLIIGLIQLAILWLFSTYTDPVTLYTHSLPFIKL